MYWVIQWDSDGCPPAQGGWIMEGTKDQAIAVLAKNQPKRGQAENVCLYEVDILENKGHKIMPMAGEGTYCCNHLEDFILKEEPCRIQGAVYTGGNGYHGFMVSLPGQEDIHESVLFYIRQDPTYLVFRANTKLEFVYDSERLEREFMGKQQEMLTRGKNVSILLKTPRSEWKNL